MRSSFNIWAFLDQRLMKGLIIRFNQFVDCQFLRNSLRLPPRSRSWSWSFHIVMFHSLLRFILRRRWAFTPRNIRENFRSDGINFACLLASLPRSMHKAILVDILKHSLVEILFRVRPALRNNRIFNYHFRDEFLLPRRGADGGGLRLQERFLGLLVVRAAHVLVAWTCAEIVLLRRRRRRGVCSTSTFVISTNELLHRTHRAILRFLGGGLLGSWDVGLLRIWNAWLRNFNLLTGSFQIWGFTQLLNRWALSEQSRRVFGRKGVQNCCCLVTFLIDLSWRNFGSLLSRLIMAAFGGFLTTWNLLLLHLRVYHFQLHIVYLTNRRSFIQTLTLIYSCFCCWFISSSNCRLKRTFRSFCWLFSILTSLRRSRLNLLNRSLIAKN